jgi:hypothetical protein
MNLRNLVCLAGSAAFAFVAFGQQPTLTVSNDHPKPGEAVVIEVNVSPDHTTKVSWTKQGDGEFTTETQNQKSVKFVPSTPGSTVIIVCDVSVPGRQDHPSTTLVVVGSQAPSQPQPGPAARSGAAARRGGDLTLADMEYMIPSGWMGDATAENNGAAILDTGFNQGCRPGSPSCIKIEYNPKDGKVGWAAFAWQRVIEGSDNWGQSPGADFSGRGFRSARVYAKGIPDAAGLFPKVQFKSGGTVAPKYSTNRASYAVAGLTVQLTGQFQEYCLSLEGRDLSNTVSPFTAVVAKAGNAQTIVIILDDVRFSTESCN